MSGHSKWSQIKRQKGVVDAKRGQLFTKLTREIVIAVRDGGSSNPELNAHLRLAIQKARDSHMPLENIQRALNKASGSTEASNLIEMTLEGYGPSRMAIIVKALTDNRNRTLQDVRTTFSRHGGSLGEGGCVSWLFDSKGLITIKIENLNAEDVALKAIDAGAEDVKIENGYIEIYTKPEQMERVRKALEQNNLAITSSELSMVPKTLVELGEKEALQALKLLEKLEDLDEVQHVASNADFPNYVLEKYQP